LNHKDILAFLNKITKLGPEPGGLVSTSFYNIREALHNGESLSMIPQDEWALSVKCKVSWGGSMKGFVVTIVISVSCCVISVLLFVYHLFMVLILFIYLSVYDMYE